VKIVDFGLALLPTDEKLTRENLSIGTPAYMSPEQIRGEVVDHRSDLWSLGVTLYEAVSRTLSIPRSQYAGIGAFNCLRRCRLDAR